MAVENINILWGHKFINDKYVKIIQLEEAFVERTILHNSLFKCEMSERYTKGLGCTDRT